MDVRRGDVVLAFYPFASGTGGSRRPAVVVQDDRDNARMQNTIIVQITTNLRRSSEPTCFLIQAASPAGRLTGLLHDSLVSCNNLATIREDRIARIIGQLTPEMLPQLDACPKAALGLS